MEDSNKTQGFTSPFGIPYEPLPKQLAFHNDPSRSKAAIGGRASGKTTAVVMEVFSRIEANPDINIAWVTDSIMRSRIVGKTLFEIGSISDRASVTGRGGCYSFSFGIARKGSRRQSQVLIFSDTQSVRGLEFDLTVLEGLVPEELLHGAFRTRSVIFDGTIKPVLFDRMKDAFGVSVHHFGTLGDNPHFQPMEGAWDSTALVR